jgi:hypothetical protein
MVKKSTDYFGILTGYQLRRIIYLGGLRKNDGRVGIKTLGDLQHCLS